MKSLIGSEFNFWRLTWMNYHLSPYCKLHRLRQSTLQIFCDNYKKSLEKFLEKEIFVAIHQSNVQYLAIEIYIVKIVLFL